MKIAKIFIIFSTLFLVNSTLSTKFLFNPTIEDKELSKGICKITNDVTNSKTDTQDILIGNLGGEVWSSTVDDIIKCIDDEKAVIVTSFVERIEETSLRKASVVILHLNGFSQNQITSLVGNHHFSSVWHHMAKLIVVVPKTVSQLHRMFILRSFRNLGFYGITVVHETNDKFARFEGFLSITSSNMAVLLSPENSSYVFLDHLKNMNGYRYVIPLHNQLPSIEVFPNYVKPALAYFLDALRTVQNSGYQIIRLKDMYDLEEFWRMRKMDLTLNSGLTFVNSEPKLFTYEKHGYCALIPIPPKTSLLQIVFVEPFDSFTWMFFILLIVCSVAVWWMFRGRGAVDSPWFLCYGMFVYFIGQGVDFSRRNRMVLTILLQLIIVMIFVLSNAYEGVITSFMIQPAKENRMKTVDDLLASDYEIMTDELFALRFKEDERFVAIKSRINTSGELVAEFMDPEIERKHYVFVRLCDISEADLSTTLPNGVNVFDHYYMLPEKLSWYFIELHASYLNPFIERFQYYMDWSFQAGLPQIWKVFANIGYQGVMDAQVSSDYIELKDFATVFFIFISGCGLSTLVLLIEILHYHCWRSMKKFINSLWVWAKKFCRIKKKSKPKVRSIFVRPSNDEYV